MSRSPPPGPRPRSRSAVVARRPSGDPTGGAAGSAAPPRSATGIRVLVIDPDTVGATHVADVIAGDGHDVELAPDLGEDAQGPFDVVVVDPGGMDPGQKIDRLRAAPGTALAEIVFVSMRGDVDAAVLALHRGASDWLVKPVTGARMRLAIGRAVERRRLLRENERLRRDLALFVAAQRVLETIDRSQLAGVGVDALCGVPGVSAAAVWGDGTHATRGLDDDEVATLLARAPPEAFVEDVQGAVAGLPRFAHVRSMDLGDGLTAAVLTVAPLLRDDDEAVLFLARQLANAVDNSERLRVAAELALRDPLTGLWNAGAFADAVDSLVDSGEGPFSLLFLDVDRFKSVNDTWGHITGSAVLTGVARTLVGTLRAGDVVARYGGDEMTVLLPGVDVDAARAVAERVRAAIEAFVLPSRPDVRVTASVGVATWPRHADDARGLLAAADTAMYAAKDLARNRVCVAADPTQTAGQPAHRHR
jgi:two-component system cell cycle response regulator